MTSGQQSVSAQAFTAGNRFSYPISVQGQVSIPGGVPQYVLLDSDPVPIRVRVPPPESELPGFTGAIGQFTLDPPRLSTNRVRVGVERSLPVGVTEHHGGGATWLVVLLRERSSPRRRHAEQWEQAIGDRQRLDLFRGPPPGDGG